MQKFVIVLILFVSISGCKKFNNKTAIEKAIIGTWELRSSFCGSVTTYPVGNGTTLIFYNSGQFKAAGILADSGAYRITANKNNLGQQAYLLFLDGSQDMEYRMAVSSDTLKLDLVAFTPDGCLGNYKKL